MTDKERTELWKDLDRRVFTLTQLTQFALTQVHDIENSLLKSVVVNASTQLTALNHLKRTITALEARIEEINMLLAAGSTEDLKRAMLLAQKDLQFKNDAVHKLLSEEALPPLPIDQARSHVEALLSEARGRKQRASSGLFS